MLRLALVALVPAFASACGSGPEVRPTPPPTPPTSGEEPARSAVRLELCIAPVDGMAPIAAYATDTQVRFCVARNPFEGPATRDCWTIDLATGAFTEGGVVPAVDEQTPAFTARASEDARSVLVCPTGLADPKCETQKPALGKGESLGAAAIDDANTRLAYVLDVVEGAGLPRVAVAPLVAGHLGKATARFGFGDESYRCPELQWVGDLLFVNASVCAGPGAAGELFDEKGKKLSDVGGPRGPDGDVFGTWGYRALPVTGGWAFLEASGKTIAIHAAGTGTLMRKIDLRPVFGDDVMFDNPGELGWARTPDGRLVVVGSSPALGLTAVVDPATGAVRKASGDHRCPTLTAP